MPIPKIIYQTWKTKQLHPNCIAVQDSIQALHPDYEMKLYDDTDIEEFIKREFDDHVYRCYMKLNVGAAKADFWRYCILYKYGGVYLDMDSVLIRPLSELIEGGEQCIITREGNPGVFNNWIMIFEKGHPILLNTIQNCCHNITHKTSNCVADLTGPSGPFTKAVNDVMVPLYNKNVNLYFEKDDTVNAILNNPEHPIRCRFHGVDLAPFAQWKHKYTDDLYRGSVYWRNERKLFKD